MNFIECFIEWWLIDDGTGCANFDRAEMWASSKIDEGRNGFTRVITGLCLMPIAIYFIIGALFASGIIRNYYCSILLRYPYKIDTDAIKTRNVSEMKAWCKECNINARFLFSFFNCTSDRKQIYNKYCVAFKNEIDATAFLLRWA